MPHSNAIDSNERRTIDSDARKAYQRLMQNNMDFDIITTCFKEKNQKYQHELKSLQDKLNAQEDKYQKILKDLKDDHQNTLNQHQIEINKLKIECLQKTNQLNEVKSESEQKIRWLKQQQDAASKATDVMKTKFATALQQYAKEIIHIRSDTTQLSIDAKAMIMKRFQSCESQVEEMQRLYEAEIDKLKRSVTAHKSRESIAERRRKDSENLMFEALADSLIIQDETDVLRRQLLQQTTEQADKVSDSRTLDSSSFCTTDEDEDDCKQRTSHCAQ